MATVDMDMVATDEGMEDMVDMDTIEHVYGSVPLRAFEQHGRWRGNEHNLKCPVILNHMKNTPRLGSVFV